MTKELQEAIEIFLENPSLSRVYDLKIQGDDVCFCFHSSAGNELGFVVQTGGTLEGFAQNMKQREQKDAESFIDDYAKTHMRAGENKHVPVRVAYENAVYIKNAIDSLYEAVQECAPNHLTRKALREQIAKISGAAIVDTGNDVSIRIDGPEEIHTNSFNTLNHHHIVLEEEYYKNPADFYRIADDIEYAKHAFNVNIAVHMFYEAGHRDDVWTVLKDAEELHKGMTELANSVDKFMSDFKEKPEELKEMARPGRYTKAHEQLLRLNTRLKCPIDFEERKAVAKEIKTLNKKLDELRNDRSEVIKRRLSKDERGE